MNITTIESKVRRMAGVSTTQYTQAQFLEDINEVKNDFWSAIVARLDEDSNYQIWTTTSVALQSEYDIPEIASDSAGAKVLKGVSVNYNGETYANTGKLKYVKAKEINPQTLEYEWDFYVENQDKNEPMYYIGDKSVFIAPAPLTTEAGVNRIKLTGIRNIVDYTISTTEQELRIPIDQHGVLMLGVLPYALMTKRVDNNEIIKAQNDYENKKAIAVANLANRKEGPIFMSYPTKESDEIVINTN